MRLTIWQHCKYLQFDGFPEMFNRCRYNVRWAAFNGTQFFRFFKSVIKSAWNGHYSRQFSSILNQIIRNRFWTGRWVIWEMLHWQVQILIFISCKSNNISPSTSFRRLLKIPKLIFTFHRIQTHLIFCSFSDNVWRSISSLILMRLQIFAESASIYNKITVLIGIGITIKMKKKTTTPPTGVGARLLLWKWLTNLWNRKCWSIFQLLWPFLTILPLKFFFHSPFSHKSLGKLSKKLISGKHRIIDFQRWSFYRDGVMFYVLQYWK